MTTPTKARLAEKLAASIYENIASPLERVRERALAPFQGAADPAHRDRKPRRRLVQLQLRRLPSGRRPRRDPGAAAGAAGGAGRGAGAARGADHGRVPGGDRDRSGPAAAAALRVSATARGRARLPGQPPARDGAHLQRRERAVLAQREADRARADRAGGIRRVRDRAVRSDREADRTGDRRRSGPADQGTSVRDPGALLLPLGGDGAGRRSPAAASSTGRWPRSCGPSTRTSLCSGMPRRRSRSCCSRRSRPSSRGGRSRSPTGATTTCPRRPTSSAPPGPWSSGRS